MSQKTFKAAIFIKATQVLVPLDDWGCVFEQHEADEEGWGINGNV
jgi:hypothetical protein